MVSAAGGRLVLCLALSRHLVGHQPLHWQKYISALVVEDVMSHTAFTMYLQGMYALSVLSMSVAQVLVLHTYGNEMSVTCHETIAGSLCPCTDH